MSEGYMQHPDERVRQKIIELCDALCMWEENTGRESSLLIIERPDFRFWADSGKSIPTNQIAPFAKIKLTENFDEPEDRG